MLGSSHAWPLFALARLLQSTAMMTRRNTTVKTETDNA